MNFVLDVCLPLLVVFIMTLVGLELRPADFARLRDHPRAVTLAAAAQCVVPPIAAFAIAQAILLPPITAGGLLIVAAAPIAALSNFYGLLARADLALTVTLTALSTVAAAVTLPATLALTFAALGLSDAGIEVPHARLVQQMAIGVLLPIGLGMSLRAWAPAWVARHRLRLQALGLAALLAIIAAIVADQFDAILGQLGVLVAVAVLFTLVTLAAGWVVARPVPVATAQRRAILFGFPARNLSIATLLAVTVFDRPEMASFGVVFFIVQASGLVPIALLVGARDRALGR